MGQEVDDLLLGCGGHGRLGWGWVEAGGGEWGLGRILGNWGDGVSLGLFGIVLVGFVVDIAIHL